MKTLEILVGYPGCGKSTYCSKLQGKSTMILSSDQIRKELYGSEETQGNPKEIFGLLYKRMEDALKDNTTTTVVFDATNLTIWERSRAIRIGKENGASVICVRFMTPLEECKHRNANRDRKVPEEIYARMVSRFEEPTAEEGFDFILYVGQEQEGGDA